ncbi:hypothetical protein TeGR_g9789 [Tetraparma gracilis]|uniref:Armadillo-type protein n=1 Tax=Tetraparma gracilis TaxID=2962635 RepID=A0ABQ6ML25_9STRA|nr:hypothetical protein TeGR_g9789 [Tetraparma gracilis]
MSTIVEHCTLLLNALQSIESPSRSPSSPSPDSLPRSSSFPGVAPGSPAGFSALYAPLSDLLASLLANPDGDNATHGQSAAPVLLRVLNCTAGALLLAPVRELLASSLTELYTSCPALDIYSFAHELADLASLTSRSPKAVNGTRLAAIQTLGQFASRPSVCPRIAGLLPDALAALCKAARSSDAAVRVAALGSCAAIAGECAAAAANNQNPKAISSPFVAQGGLAEPAAAELLRAARRAVEDRLPAARCAAGRLAAALAPLTVAAPTSKNPTGLAQTDELLLLALLMHDDEAPRAGGEFSRAAAACVGAAVAASRHRIELQLVDAAKREVEDEEGDGQGGAKNKRKSNTEGGLGFKFKLSKGPAVMEAVQACRSLHEALAFFVSYFSKIGGEASAGLGGYFSTGGRLARKQVANTMSKILTAHVEAGTLFKSGSTPNQLLTTVLSMLDHAVFEKQGGILPFPQGGSGASAGFGSSAINSPPSSSDRRPSSSSSPSPLSTDVKFATVACSGVLRSLGSCVAESTQISILTELGAMLIANGGDREGKEAADPVTPTRDRSTSLSIVSKLNQQQLQVCLIEISHLLASLSSASAIALSTLTPSLHMCLGHKEHGVRFEAATALASVARIFPSQAFPMLTTAVAGLSSNLVELQQISQTDPSEPSFARSLYSRMYRVNGLALLCTMIFHALTDAPPSVQKPSAIRDQIAPTLDVARRLISAEFKTPTPNSINRTLACTTMRAGFCVLSGMLSLGPAHIKQSIGSFFGIWQTAVEHAKSGHPAELDFEVTHDLICLDAALNSMLCFVRHCPSLLLDVPDALTRTSILLEELLAVVAGSGRLANPDKANAVSRLDIVKASLMESFSWLPPGSFPIVADKLFGWATEHLRVGTLEGIQTSLLPILADESDSPLDIRPNDAATSTLECGGDRAMVDLISFKDASQIDHAEREAMLHFDCLRSPESEQSGDHVPPPTPMHAAGNWKAPPLPFASSSTRLIDACVHMFAALFGLQDDSNQNSAVNALLGLLPPVYLGVKKFDPTAGLANTFTSETEKGAKTRANDKTTVNIVSCLLSCLQSLPEHASDIASDMVWVKKAQEILVALLAVPSSIVRRAAGEAIGLLCNRVKGHLLQDTITAVSNITEGLFPSGKKRGDVQSATYAKSGGLFCLAQIGRGNVVDQHQIITLVLAKARDMKEPDLVRQWALYALSIILENVPLGADSGAVRTHLTLLSDVVDVILSNFLSSFTADALAPILRLNTCLLQIFFELDPSHPGIVALTQIVAVAKTYDHNTVNLESLRFIELLSIFDPKQISSETIDFLMTVDSSSTALQIAVRGIKGYILHNKEKVWSMQLHSKFLGLLEKIHGRRCCVHGVFFRGIAVERGVDVVMKRFDAAVIAEIAGAVDGDDDDKDAAAAVDEGWTLQKTVQHYRTEANDEAALVFDGQSTRWQVKNQATLVATNLLSRFEEDGVTFDVVGARSAFTGSSSSKDAPPKTYLALHVEELVAAACTSSTFTSGEDLVPLQTNGLALLTLLLRKFKSAKDPDSLAADSTETMLSTIASQITAALKPALAKGGEGGYHVDWLEAGLSGLLHIAPHISASVVKRMAKPVLSEVKGGAWEGAGTRARVVTLCRLLIATDDFEGKLLAEDSSNSCYENFAKILKYELAREPPKKPVSTGWELKSTLCLGLAVGLKTGRARKELAGLVLGLSVEGLSISKTQEPDVVARLLQCLEYACTDGSEETLGLCLNLLELLPNLHPGAKFQCLKTAAAILQNYKGEHESAASLKKCLARTAAENNEWDIWRAVGEGLGEEWGGAVVKDAILQGKVNVKDIADKMDVEDLMRELGPVILGGFLKWGCTKGGTGKAMELLRYLLLGYKNVVAKGGEGRVQGFLNIIMPVFIKVIEYNGLPQGFMAGGGGSAGDVQLGKTLATSLLHFVKTSGGEFKAVMGGVGDKERGVLEKAVRGEMTGYGGAQSQAQAAPQRLTKLTAKKAAK